MIYVQGGLCPLGVSVRGRSLSRRGIIPGGLCPGVAHTITYGWYTSYWNTFLLSVFVSIPCFDLLSLTGAYSTLGVLAKINEVWAKTQLLITNNNNIPSF